MSDRVAEALSALRAQLAALEGVARSTSDAEWQRETAAERWPVGLVAFHIARGFQRQAEFIEDALQRATPHRFDWDVTHALNASIAAEHPSPSRDDVVALARTSVGRIVTALGAATDEGLGRTAWVFEGRERDAVWVAGRLAPQHARGHLESIARAVG